MKMDSRFESINEETERLKKGLEMVLYVARLETFDTRFLCRTDYNYIK